ncbi:pelargonidin 3-O-(6-caffeoylglucoside) 5-O-(6-O-malonylglucoside) 4'''-malonyltransferase-like [Apium graveolens]|uniref:pelargonidin 3-O-(6-caffeoylglucoside) 5-O-(6-O-malonylglucoside) 4'''-malonyltransferase-like n=1 Tax=Apium graveolens TaxID=4045 RepID=UPI003D7A352B
MGIKECNKLFLDTPDFNSNVQRYRVDSHSVDCGDQGTEYVKANVDIRLDVLVSQRMNVKAELFNDLVPCPIGVIDGCDDPLLAIQVSAFSCGAVAITVFNAWAIAAKQELGYVDENFMPIAPNFDSVFLFPVKMLPCLPTGLARDKENIEVHKIVTKMFHFEKSKISSIRERVRLDDSSLLPSRVQSIFGLIEKAIIDGVVDACRTVLSPGKERETMISHGVYKLISSFSDPNMFFAASFTSWSKFPFYEADFGWGKPVWFRLGCVIRDEVGAFVKARSNVLRVNMQAREAEALSLKETLSWTKTFRSSKCIFESDSKMIVDAVNGNRGASMFDTIAEDCSELIKHFDGVLVIFVHRSVNKIAHLVAQAFYSMSGLQEWQYNSMLGLQE